MQMGETCHLLRLMPVKGTPPAAASHICFFLCVCGISDCSQASFRLAALRFIFYLQRVVNTRPAFLSSPS